MISGHVWCLVNLFQISHKDSLSGIAGPVKGWIPPWILWSHQILQGIPNDTLLANPLKAITSFLSLHWTFWLKLEVSINSYVRKLLLIVNYDVRLVLACYFGTLPDYQRSSRSPAQQKTHTTYSAFNICQAAPHQHCYSCVFLEPTLHLPIAPQWRNKKTWQKRLIYIFHHRE